LEAPGVKLAHQHFPIDITDTKNILKAIDGMKFDFIWSDQTDLAVKTFTELSDQHNLPGNALSTIPLFTIKSEMRKHCQKLHIPSPKWKLISQVSELSQSRQELKGPLILKPVDSRSSRGIHKIENHQEIAPDILSESLAHSKQGQSILEEFVDGLEVTVEGLCINRNHHCLAFSTKKHFRLGIASDLAFPGSLSEDQLQTITNYLSLYVEASELGFGLTHAEFLVGKSSQEIYLVEIAARGGGSLCSSLIAPWMSGIDPYQHVFEYALFDRTLPIPHSPKNRFAHLHFFEFQPGKVVQISGIDEIKQMKNIAHIQLDIAKGDLINPASDDRSRHGFVIILSEEASQIEETLKKVEKSLKITVST
tara:strand:- start:431 stop:1525 length:1095 start_codon:yes stop_codon:yes gene_type:complete